MLGGFDYQLWRSHIENRHWLVRNLETVGHGGITLEHGVKIVGRSFASMLLWKYIAKMTSN